MEKYKNILNFLKEKGLIKDADCESDLKKYNNGIFYDKDKEWMYQLILPHEDICNLYLLRKTKLETFDRWANSTDGELFFYNLNDLKEIYDNEKEWTNFRIEDIIFYIATNNKIEAKNE